MQSHQIPNRTQSNVLDHPAYDSHDHSLLFAVGQLQYCVYLIPSFLDIFGDHIEEDVGDQIFEHGGRSLEDVEVDFEQLSMPDVGIVEFEDLHGELLVGVDGGHGDILARVHADVAEVILDGRPHSPPQIIISLDPLQVVFHDFGDVMQDVQLSGVALVGCDLAGAELTHRLQELLQPDGSEFLGSGEQFVRSLVLVVVVGAL